MSSDYPMYSRVGVKALTDPQRISRLPKGAWFINVYQENGDTNYQIQADDEGDGEVIGNFQDSHYDAPGMARAIAEQICTWRREMLAERAKEKVRW